MKTEFEVVKNRVQEIKTLACTKCMWCGNETDCTEYMICPECGSKVEYINAGYMWESFGDGYNWNKR